MAKHFDKDIELDEEGEDAYAAAMAVTPSTKGKGAADADDDEAEDEPSVEAEIAALEGGLVDDGAPKRKLPPAPKDELDEEAQAADELRMIDELAETIAEERESPMDEEEEGF